MHQSVYKMPSFADNIFECIFYVENICIVIQISLKFIVKGQIDDKPSLVYVMVRPCFTLRPRSSI